MKIRRYKFIKISKIFKGIIGIDAVSGIAYATLQVRCRCRKSGGTQTYDR